MRCHYHDTASDVLIIEAEGGLDESMALHFVNDLKERIDQGLAKVVCDCSRMDFISSLDLGLLVRMRSKVLEHGGDLKLCSVRDMVHKVLDATSMQKIFDIQPDLESALSAFNHGRRNPEIPEA